MRPRRPFRRNMLRRLPPALPGAGAPPLLLDANRLFMDAHYVPAGERYAALAASAEQHQMPQAVQLNLQAARSFLLAHHPDRAEQLAQQGLHLLAIQGRIARLQQLGARVVWEFEYQGHKVHAQRLSAWLAGMLPPMEKSAEAAPEPEQRAGLPRLCPSCGAPVDPRDVEWADERTAMCAFCASSLGSEG